MGQRHELARVMSTLARNLEAETNEEETLGAVVQTAVNTVPGVWAGGITQVHRRQVHARVPTDEVVRKCDEAQQELGEGPCLDAIWQHETVVVDDMNGETRWPWFAARASELGVGSLISFRLFVQDDTLGALNLYGGHEVRFGEEVKTIGEIFAAHAALALSGARYYRQLSEAMTSRDNIGQAKGLLMCQHDLTAQQAFDLLVRASQQSNIKLTEVAAWVVAEHENPGGASRPQSN
ncbi:MAG: GAF and ANTAR domain-containing protein [Saccharopolyspora sp.]|uniref:GAF and ANTAR domain-containing protein n=1 Tax=Saccharopolyspora sp. TaxID=33915 RepID=UPI0025F34B82|nr:GAF and ANTAR domain-containing protein [Saccharopolyspora sp.]MBQ6641449.1 GAF and ANTAR domain-containing protein [Saccharopolyspora sp.]